jgi:hypothetical protein
MGPIYIERGMFLLHLGDAKKRVEHRGQHRRHRRPHPSGPDALAQHPPGADRRPTQAHSGEPAVARGEGGWPRPR